MKFIILFLITIFLIQICFSQSADTIRIYDYENGPDTWKLEVKNNKTFRLYNSITNRNEFTTSGMYFFNDTTVSFICDTTKLKNRNLARDKIRQFSNLPFILSGEAFIRQKGFFIPNNINYNPYNSTIMPKGIFARYYSGDGFGSCIIELKEDSSYVFNSGSCSGIFSEKGNWSLYKGVITFKAPKNKWSMLEWVTKDRKMYLTGDYLIGKKINSARTSRKIIVTERYVYLSKMSEYVDN